MSARIQKPLNHSLCDRQQRLLKLDIEFFFANESAWCLWKSNLCCSNAEMTHLGRKYNRVRMSQLDSYKINPTSQMFGRLCPRHLVSCRTETTPAHVVKYMHGGRPQYWSLMNLITSKRPCWNKRVAPVDYCSSPPLPPVVHLKRLESTSKGCFAGDVRWPHWHGSECLLICRILVTSCLRGVTGVIIGQGLPRPTFLFHSCPSAVCSPIIRSYFVKWAENQLFFFPPWSARSSQTSKAANVLFIYFFFTSSQR